MSDEKPYVLPQALPTTWRDGATGKEVAGKEVPVVTGTEVEEMQHVLATQRVCGTCKYFSHAEGQRLMQAQRFVERLVREDHWQVKHLASPVNTLGVCGAHTSGASGEEEMLTGAMHKACDQYRDNRGIVSISRKGNY